MLIICALMLTAATVVFVNRTEDWRAVAEHRKLLADRLQRDKDEALKEAIAARQRETATVAEKNTALAAKQTELASMKAAVDKAINEIGELKTKGQVDQATITEQATALKTAQQHNTDLESRNKGLVEAMDKLKVTNFELTGANTDYQKRLDEAERERKWLIEQLAQIKADFEKLRNLAIEFNLPLDAKRPPVASAPDIKGVIVEVTTKDGQTYATISVGAADKVAKGMEFTVINQNTAEFLGKLVVDTVDQRSSFGRLEGPRIQEVKPDFQVLSQL
jgi:chromosome segregation ATPase